MDKINAIISGVAGYVPDYVLNNEELSASSRKKGSVLLIWPVRPPNF